MNDAILAVLHDQKQAWNAGDVDEFMARGYWHSDELVFVSGESEHRGYDAVLARYRARYTVASANAGLPNTSCLGSSSDFFSREEYRTCGSLFSV